MREALAIAAAVVATPVAAQTAGAPAAPQSTPQYLSWPGKVPPASAIVAPPPTPAPASTVAATQAAAPASTASPVEPPRADGPRRYSVHRDFGLAPDRTALPAEFFLDGLPVDLAEPPPQPLSERDERRLRALADPDSPQ